MTEIVQVILERQIGLRRRKCNAEITKYLDDKTAKSSRLNTAFPTPPSARCCFLVSFSADFFFLLYVRVDTRYLMLELKAVSSSSSSSSFIQWCQTDNNGAVYFLSYFVRDQRFNIIYKQTRALLASTHGDHSISVFNSNSGKLVKQLVGHKRTPWCLAFHPYLSNILASGCLGGEVRIWDVKTNACCAYSPCGNHVVTSIAFHPHDDVLAIGSQNVLTLWNWQDATVVRQFSTRKVQEGVRMVKFHPLGDWLLTGVTNLPSERHYGPMFLEVPSAREQAGDNRLVQTVSCVTLRPGSLMETEDESSPVDASSLDHQGLDLVGTAHNADQSSELAVAASHQDSNPHSSFVVDPVLSAEIEADDRANPSRTVTSDANTSGNPDPLGDSDLQLPVITQSNALSATVQPNDGAEGPSYQSEMWSLNLGARSSSVHAARGAGVELAVTGSDSDDDTSTTIPVHSFISHPRRVPTTQPATTSSLDSHSVATATARTSRHVHTAIVISSRDYSERQLALRTAVNRAIASAFTSNGEGAVACNIINTTQRLQMWKLRQFESIDLKDRTRGLVVPACKLHNDSSLDISTDGTVLATFLPSPLGFPDDGQLSLISLMPSSLGQCLYKRRYGPNAVSVSISPSKQYALVGLASKRLMWQIMDKQLMGQVVRLPTETEKPVIDDCNKPVFSVVHGCNGNERYHLSVNTARFHPLAGSGFFYGTNRGHIQHCQVRLRHGSEQDKS